MQPGNAFAVNRDVAVYRTIARRRNGVCLAAKAAEGRKPPIVAGYEVEHLAKAICPLVVPILHDAEALRSVMAGQSVLEGEVLERATTLGGNVATGDESALAPLSQREREVVRLVSEGLDNSQIAARLFLSEGRLFMSEGTVRNHISAILAKLALRNRTQIAVFYYRRCQ